MNLIPYVHNTNFCKQFRTRKHANRVRTDYWQTVWGYPCGQTKWQIHKTENITFPQHRWWAVMTLEFYEEPVQRTKKIPHLSSWIRGRWGEKNCTRKFVMIWVLKGHMVGVEIWILPMGNVWPNRLERCVVTTPHSLVCLHRPYFWTDYWQVLNLLWGKFTPVDNRTQ